MANPNLAGDPNPEPFVPEHISRATPYAQRLAHHVVEPPAVKPRLVPAPPGANRSAAAVARLASKNAQQEPDPNNPSNADIMDALRSLRPTLEGITRRLDHVERSVGSFEPPPPAPLAPPAPPAPMSSDLPRDTEVNRGR